MKIIINGQEAEIGSGLYLIQPGYVDFSIEIVTPPTKTSYFAGQTFDSTGMVARGTFANGFTVDIPHEYLAFSPDGELDEGIDQVEVSFQGVAVYQEISVAEAPEFEFEWWSPKMTSNTAPNPYKVNASSEYTNVLYAGFRAFNGINTDYWGSNSGLTQWISFDYGSELLIKGISLSTVSNLINAFPMVWDLYGSNDGETWTTIYHADGSYPSTIKEYVNYEYTFNTVSYRHYKFVCTGNYGGASHGCGICEIMFLRGQIYAPDE